MLKVNRHELNHYPRLVQDLDLIIEEIDFEKKDTDDIIRVYNNYVPISIRLVEKALFSLYGYTKINVLFSMLILIQRSEIHKVTIPQESIESMTDKTIEMTGKVIQTTFNYSVVKPKELTIKGLKATKQVSNTNAFKQ